MHRKDAYVLEGGVELAQQQMHCIYHFTNIANLKNIMQYGLRADSQLDERDYVSSGDPDIKERRKSLQVCLNNGHVCNVVSDYVPFYFAPRSPMLYAQWRHGRINNNDTIYLVTTVEHIISKKYTWCFSDINAAIFEARFFNDYHEMIYNIDWNLMNETYWHNTDDFPNRMQRRMAEFLVLDRVSFFDILGIGVYNNEAYNMVSYELHELQSQGYQVNVFEERGWYYS